LRQEGCVQYGNAFVAVPLLVGLGFPAPAAAIAGMIIQSTPVSFGACGTPILVGVNTGLSADPVIRRSRRKRHLSFLPSCLCTETSPSIIVAGSRRSDRSRCRSSGE